MAKLPLIDFEASEAVDLAPSDSNEAARALLMAAKYIREEKPLPRPLSGYLADAIEYSMHKDKDHRNTAFLRELHLEAENRRPAKARWIDVGYEVEELIEEHGYSQNKATKEVAEKRKVSASTAKRLYKVWLQAIAETQEINREHERLERES